MMLPDSTITALQTWCGTQPVKLCVLFGSQATGRARPDSDVDLAVWPSNPQPPLQQLVWLNELETSLGREVNLVLVSPQTNPVLGFEIIKHGRLIFEATPETWAATRLYWWHQFNDTAHFRRAAEESLRKFAAEVQHGS